MKTFAKEIKISGVGIHSGAPVNMRILPSDEYGIFFRRTDLAGAAPIPATYDNVSDFAKQNTTVGTAPNCVQTIEHLMAALFLYGIDSAVIEIDGPETPILDGSAKRFMEMFAKVKVKSSAPMKKIVVKKEITVYRRDIIKKMPFINRVLLWIRNMKLGVKEDGFVRLSPDSGGLVVCATMDYPDQIIGRQYFEYVFDGTDTAWKIFESDIAPSRTFGRFDDWEYLKKRGMAKGCDATNVIALNKDGTGVENPQPYGLHCADEFVRHKIIDCVGDMYTAGGFVVGRMESMKGSHGLNNLALRKLFANPSNYDIITEN